MERSNIPEEENHSTWSSGSVIPIRAITIELNFPMEMPQTSENRQHSNFSIRGYAAEKRRRDLKAFDPFQFDDETPQGPAQLSSDQEMVPEAIYYNADVAETPQGPAQLSSDHEMVPEATYYNAEAADAQNEPLEPSGNTDCAIRDYQTNTSDTTDTDDSDYQPINISDNDELTLEETDDEFDDLLPLSKLRKPVTRSLPKILPEENMNYAGDGERGVETPLISRDPNQNRHEVVVDELLVSVAPDEVEDMNNSTCDSDQSQERVPYPTKSHRKARKVRKLSDLMRETGTMNHDQVQEGDTSISSWVICFTEAPNSFTHGQILSEEVVRDANSPGPKWKMHQEGDRSLGQGTITEKSNDHVTNRDAVPTVERIQISSSGVQDNAHSNVGLQLGNKAQCLKRGAKVNHYLVTKKAKSAQILETFHLECKSASVRSGDLKRSGMSNTFGSPSSAAKPNNNFPDNPSYSEIDRIRSDVTQTELQIPNSTTMKGSSSMTLIPKIDNYHAWTDSNKNRDGGETSSFQRKTDFRLAESVSPPASTRDLLNMRHVLDLNETATHDSSDTLANGSFNEPKERDSFPQIIIENQGPRKSNIQQCEQRHGKAVVQDSSAEFPKEVVELMAKHQYERTLGINAGSHLVPPRPINTMRSFPELQNIRNTESLGYSGSNGFVFQNARSVMSTPTTNMGAEKGNSIDNFQIGSKNNFNKGRIDVRHLNIFNAFQQKQQTISSRGPFFDASTTCVKSVPQRSVVLERSLLYRPTVSQFEHDSLQNFSAQTPMSSYDKGKTISDIKADELKKTKEARSVLPRPGDFNFNHKLKGPYSNDNITAMQLLSLRGDRSTGSTFNVGTSRFLDKPIGYQLNSNAEGMRGFLNGSMSLNHNQPNKVHNAEHPFAFSGALSLDPKGRDRLRERSQISRYDADVSDQGRSSSNGNDYKQKAIVVCSDIAEDAIQHFTSNGTQIYIEMETEGGLENIMPLRILPPDDICNINRNPADFSSPERNEFTIHGRDIKFRKRKYSRSNSSVRIEEPKQHGNAKGKGKEK